ncbi:MAG: DUF169 domain-containing protein [candidate division Zixibacteria bacterium]|nr:DUF169 domain-containing protein [candidate division Zixibacteria bacterium]
MDTPIRDKFIHLWKKYFNTAKLPVSFYYKEEKGTVEEVEPASGHRCMICDLARVRKGGSLCFSADSIGCGGGKRYSGFVRELMPDFEYFLSCGIPGKLEGERYKKSPELVRKAMKKLPRFTAPARYIVFKRWDKLEEKDNPEVVVFFSSPDVLSGLFTLTNFDQIDPNGVFTPFAAGCGSIVQFPYLEKDSTRPRGVLGMFDVSARPCVPQNILTFSVPITKFMRMIENMEESFLVTTSWEKVSKRISQERTEEEKNL